MITDDPRSPSGALSAALVLQAVEGTGGAAAPGTVVAAETGLAVRSIWRAATPSVPAYWVGDIAGTSIVAIAGCSTLQHGLQLVNGYTLGQDGTPTAPSNPYLSYLAELILADMRTQSIGQQQDLLIIGHSLGGAVAAVLADGYVVGPTGQRVSVGTFGAPKPGNAGMARFLSVLPYGRWMNDDDPVPYVMPAVLDDYCLALVYPAPILLMMEFWVQPKGGLQLSPAGLISAQQYPTNGNVGNIAGLAAWLYSLDTGAPSSHNIGSYIDRLGSAVKIAGSAPTTPARVAVASVPDSPTASELGNEQRRAVADLQDQEAGNHAVGATIPPAWVVSVSRLGPAYAVVSNGQVLCISSRRRSARAIARALRAALHSIQLAGFVAEPSFSQWLGAYLQAAQTPGSGFSPLLKTTLDGQLPAGQALIV